MVGNLIRDGRASVKVLQTREPWFGITYREDKAAVTVNIRRLVDFGVYPADARF